MTKPAPDDAPMETRLANSIPVSPWYTSKVVNLSAVMMIMTPDEDGVSPDVDVVAYDSKPYTERMPGVIGESIAGIRLEGLSLLFWMPEIG